MRGIRDVKVGYLVEVEYLGEISLSIITYNRDDELCLSGKGFWSPLNKFNDMFNYDDVKLNKIYGRTNNFNSHKLNIEDRELLWKREDEVKEMTLEEVIEELGYEIKITK